MIGLHWEELAYVLIIVCLVSLVAALFFGFVLADQNSVFYDELNGLPQQKTTPQDAQIWRTTLLKYRDAWQFPNFIGFCFAILSLGSGVASLSIIKWKIE